MRKLMKIIALFLLISCVPRDAKPFGIVEGILVTKIVATCALVGFSGLTMGYILNSLLTTDKIERLKREGKWTNRPDRPAVNKEIGKIEESFEKSLKKLRGSKREKEMLVKGFARQKRAVRKARRGYWERLYGENLEALSRYKEVDEDLVKSLKKSLPWYSKYRWNSKKGHK